MRNLRLAQRRIVIHLPTIIYRAKVNFQGGEKAEGGAEVVKAARVACPLGGSTLEAEIASNLEVALRAAPVDGSRPVEVAGAVVVAGPADVRGWGALIACRRSDMRRDGLVE